jgi:hypothetical protein
MKFIKKIIKLSVLHCNGFFLRKPHFHFAEPWGSAEHHLENTGLGNVFENYLQDTHTKDITTFDVTQHLFSKLDNKLLVWSRGQRVTAGG